MIGELVAKLIAGGTAPDLAAVVVAEAFAAGVMSVNPQNPQTSRDESVTRRRENDRIRQQIRRDNLRTSADSRDNPQTSNSASISIDLEKRERQNKKSVRGHRIAPDWSPSDDEKAFARQEGFSELEVQREGQKFRDYWTACAGAKGVKLDWPATWRQWIRSGADRAGKKPSPSSNVEIAENNWDQVLTTYKKLGRWSRWAGPDPDSPACQCPHDLLEKYGIPLPPLEAAQ